MAGRHPALVFLAAALIGFLFLASASVALGALIVHLIVPIGGIDAADESVVKDLVSIRDETLTDISAVFSTAAGGLVLPAIAAVAAIACVSLRRWALAAFLPIGLSIESASYQLAAIVNPRTRPEVVRLDGYPPDASFPSGHTAAAIVVYGGLAILLAGRMPDRWARRLLVAAAILVVASVGASRMYRGMHHPTDLAGGVFVGCAALAVMFGACRAATAAAARRTGERAVKTLSRRQVVT